MDGPTDEEIEAAADRSIEMFDDLIERLDDEADPLGVAYGLWVHLGRYLAEGGWTVEEMAKDTTYHANDQLAGGRA
jgi:hypothetical protein